MAVFLNRKLFKRGYELGDYFIINDLIHDATSFAPLFLGFLGDFNGHPNSILYCQNALVRINGAPNYMTVNEFRYFKNMRNFARQQKAIDDLSGKTYQFIGYIPNISSNQQVYKYTVGNFNTLPQARFRFFNGTAGDAAKIFYEDANYLRLCSIISSSSSVGLFYGTGYRITTYRKASNDTVEQTEQSTSDPITITPFYFNPSNGDLYYLRNPNLGRALSTSLNAQVRVNRTNSSTFTIILQFNELGTNASLRAFFPSNTIDVAPNVKGFYLPFRSGNNATIEYVEVDVLNDTATRTTTTINQASNPNGNEFTYTTTTEISALQDAYVLQDSTGATYLAVFKITSYFGSATIKDKLYLFQIDPANNANLTQIDTLDLVVPNASVKEVVPLTPDNRIFLINYPADSIVKIIRFNETLKKFEVVESKSALQSQIGIDSQGRLQVQDEGSDNVLLEGIAVPYTIDLKLAQQYYQYNGTPILTDLTINAYDYLGQRTTATVEITLRGPAEFTDGTKVKTFATSTTADTIVQIRIIGAGYIEAIPRIIL